LEPISEGSRVSSNPAGATGFFIYFLPLSNKPFILYVAKPVGLVVFDNPLDASQSVCKMAIESLVLFGSLQTHVSYCLSRVSANQGVFKVPLGRYIFSGKVLE
jgi:hypothetical protein